MACGLDEPVRELQEAPVTLQPRDSALHSGRSGYLSPPEKKGLLMTERTLILLKPDCVEKGLCGDVLRRFEDAGFKLRGAKMMRLTNELLAEHYAHIVDRPFFPQVREFMQKTPVIALALEGDDAVQRVRDLLGPTDSKEAAPGTIRGDYGEDKTINVVHASDSGENARLELRRFFREEELFDY